jgi:hypothetical protein
MHVHHRVQVLGKYGLNMVQPAKVLARVHGIDVRMQSLGEFFRMDVLLENGKDLVEKLLLM